MTNLRYINNSIMNMQEGLRQNANRNANRLIGPVLEEFINSVYGALIEYALYKDCFLHCEDGPALKWTDGSTIWYLHGKCHREDGPAIEWSDGTKEYWLDGKRIKSKNYDSPKFKRRWKQLVASYQVRKVMES